MRVFVLCVSAALSFGASAQTVVAPAEFAAADAPSALWAPGFESTFRQQILIEPRHLGGLVGKRLRALSLRRDTGRAHRALQSTQSTWTVRLSTSPRPAAAPSPAMADNVGPDVVTVYAGLVAIPPAPAVAAGSDGSWDPANAVRIVFDTSFVYSGGTLCVDIDGEATFGGSEFWPVDAAFDPVRGSSRRFGASCGWLGGATRPFARVAADTLVAGGTARFTSRGEPGASAVMVIAIRPAPRALSLVPFGADADCYLHLDSVIAALTTSVGPPVAPRDVTFGGIAALQLPLPNTADAFNARFAVQWVTLGLSLAASEALECTLAGAVPALGMSTVDRTDATPPGLGNVSTVRAPVVRFEGN